MDNQVNILINTSSILGILDMLEKSYREGRLGTYIFSEKIYNKLIDFMGEEDLKTLNSEIMVKATASPSSRQTSFTIVMSNSNEERTYTLGVFKDRSDYNVYRHYKKSGCTNMCAYSISIALDERS